MPDPKELKYLRFPAISHGAEFLVQGYLMRRNILAYKAPPNNEGCDLICIHPNPRKKVKSVRVQVKSRYQTDCDRSIIVHRKSLDAFDFLVAVFLNVGNFYGKDQIPLAGKREPEFFTFPAAWVRRHQDKKSSWGKLRLRRLDTNQFKDGKGFELIAKALGIQYPVRARQIPGIRTNDQRRTTND
jgi:hypothetical protein